jgi:CBS domain-containing protein
MTVGEACTRDVIVTKPNATVIEAARLMKMYHVGDVVVVEEREGGRTPVGILTDRDVALSGVVDQAVRLPYLRVADLMSRNLVTSLEDESLREAVTKMRSHGVRRLPVVNAAGGLEGILTFDDVIQLLSEELSDLATLLAREEKRERMHGLEP